MFATAIEVLAPEVVNFVAVVVAVATCGGEDGGSDAPIEEYTVFANVSVVAVVLVTNATL